MRKSSLLGVAALLGAALSSSQLEVRAQSRPEADAAVASKDGRRESGLRIQRSSGSRAPSPAVRGSALATVGIAASASPPSAEYQILTIAPLPGRELSRALGINATGQVAGRFYNYDEVAAQQIDRQAFLWEPCCGPRLLPGLGGESSAWGLNDSGLASGWAYDGAGRQRAARWDTAASPPTVVDLGTLTNATTGVSGNASVAYDLSEIGQVTGYADIPNDAGDFTPFHAFVHDDLQGMTDIGTFDTLYPQYQFGYSISYDANTDEKVVGLAHNSSFEFRAFVYDPFGGLRELQRDLTYGPNEWYAVAINDAGQIGGHVIVGTDQSLPYFWADELSAPVPLAMPAASPWGEVYAINGVGTMVGIMWDAGGADRAFVWDAVQGVRDLNDLIDPGSGWVLEFARDINDAGQIAGTGTWYGVERGFVLTPTSSPDLGWIDGSVVDQASGAPLQDVRVALHDATGQPLAEVVTGSDGSWASPLLPAGSYFATARASGGYLDEAWDDLPCTDCAPETGQPIAVATGAVTAGIDFALGDPSRPAGTPYEDAEDGATDRWVVYDADPPGASVGSVYDAARRSQVIELLGTGTGNGFRLLGAGGGPWGNTTQTLLRWSQSFAGSFVIYVDVETTAGQRFLYYTPTDSDSLGTGRYVQHGLGSRSTDGRWRTFVRDLQSDLDEAQPGNSVLEVNGFLVRGSGRVDDVGLWSAVPPALYEDAEDGTTDRWIVYDTDPPGAALLNLFDETRRSRVVELVGTGTGNGFRLRNADGTGWSNTHQRVIEWSMAFGSSFVVYVDVETTAGQRFLYYTPVDYDTLGTGQYVQHGLGSNAADGSWRTFVRDLQADLEEAQPGTGILEVQGLLVRGSGRVDEVRLWDRVPVTVYEDAEDGATPGWVVYDTDPPGAVVQNVYDDFRRGRVIDLQGTGTGNGFRLRSDDGSPWANGEQRVLEWSMAFAGSFVVYVDVETTAGQRFLYYTPVDGSSLGSARYVQHGLGSGVADGRWRTFVRDLQADLEEAQPGQSILEVNALLIRGSGRLDDVRLRRN